MTTFICQPKFVFFFTLSCCIGIATATCSVPPNHAKRLMAIICFCSLFWAVEITHQVNRKASMKPPLWLCFSLISRLFQGGQVLLCPNRPRHLLLPPAPRGSQGPEAWKCCFLREAGRRQAHRLRLQQPLPARKDAEHVLRLAGLLGSWNTAGGRVRRSGSR